MKKRISHLLGAAIAALFVSACAGEAERVRGSGSLAAPPAGWVDYCERNPQDPSCTRGARP